MAFADEYASRLADAGISVDPGSLPDEETVRQSLDACFTWFFALNPALREGFDEGTVEFALCHVLAEPELNVAPALAGLFEAFDQVSGKSLSELLQIANDAIPSGVG
ncbi:hypothetical protein [Nonomuraea sediminis]|uniref:hypothetical protein n=1 Tax=Nonomuraea sediminis TaxID=2835864 RepID=UPI001BDD0A27|nr:hypothetical protein [Nonomuraea sediminis]